MHFNKIMETAVYNNPQSYAFSNKIFKNNQHGFLLGRSTCTQQLECQHNQYVVLDNNIVTDVTFIDFTTARTHVYQGIICNVDHVLLQFGPRLQNRSPALINNVAKDNGYDRMSETPN